MTGWWHFWGTSRRQLQYQLLSRVLFWPSNTQNTVVDGWKLGKQFCHVCRNVMLVEMPPSCFPTKIYLETQRISKRALGQRTQPQFRTTHSVITIPTQVNAIAKIKGPITRSHAFKSLSLCWQLPGLAGQECRRRSMQWRCLPILPDRKSCLSSGGLGFLAISGISLDSKNPATHSTRTCTSNMSYRLPDSQIKMRERCRLRHPIPSAPETRSRRKLNPRRSRIGRWARYNRWFLAVHPCWIYKPFCCSSLLRFHSWYYCRRIRLIGYI